jgi:hypothetical protein
MFSPGMDFEGGTVRSIWKLPDIKSMGCLRVIIDRKGPWKRKEPRCFTGMVIR